MRFSDVCARGALFAVLAGTLLLPAPAAAENPFVAFLRGDWLRPRPAPPPVTYVAPAPSGLSITVTPRRSRSSSGGTVRRSSGGDVVYCVRTCDGRYFPLTGVSSSNNEDAVERCNSFCPATSTKVFVSNDSEAGIDAARAKDGTAYTSLERAHAYRTEIYSNCSCNAGTSMGVATIDIMDDPTLKSGDLVVTAEGVKVFRGDKSVPHREREFQSAVDDRRLSKSMRRQIEALEMASGLAQAPVATATAAPGL